MSQFCETLSARGDARDLRSSGKQGGGSIILMIMVGSLSSARNVFGWLS